MVRHYLLGLVLLLGLTVAGCATGGYSHGAKSAPFTLYLVRHAEKDPGADPDLTPYGRERAQLLAELMQAEAPDLVYSTNLNRTRQTAAPTALALELPILYYDPSDLDGFAERLMLTGQSALIVGHSNTTPALVEALGGEPGTPIVEANEYDRLYVVRLARGETTTELRRFGKRFEGE